MLFLFFLVYKSSNKLLEITSIKDNKTSIEMENLNNTGISKTSNNSSTLPLMKFKSETLLTPKKSKKAMDLERTIKCINKGYKVLVIMRGLPGSGKSTLAQEVLNQTIGYNEINCKVHILSTDDFFCQNPQKSYDYDVAKIGEAHNWNQRRAFEAMSRGFSPVIIDNTNTQMWEMQPYATMACDFGYYIEILEPDTHWCFNDKELFKRSKHGVPKSKIIEMMERFDKNVTPLKLLSAYNLGYKFQKPPQLRSHPPLKMTTSQSVTGLNTNSVRSEQVVPKHVFNLNCPTGETTKAIETIDLMEFNDEENSQGSTKPSVANSTNKKITRKNLVDEILMVNNDSSGTNILQPQQNSMEVVTIDSDEETIPKANADVQPAANVASNSHKHMFDKVELAWGVNEKSLRSWGIVTPLEDPGNLISFSNNLRSEQKTVKTVDQACNTCESDFDILKDPANIKADVIVMITLSRDINRYTPLREKKIPMKSTIDKSCMTEDVYEDYEHHMEELTSLFPAVPLSHLR